MIKAIEITNFRGIKQATFELGPLTVFVGTNGSGKSAVLEAIYIAGADETLRAFQHVAQSRPDIEDKIAWLLFKNGLAGDTKVEGKLDDRRGRYLAVKRVGATELRYQMRSTTTNEQYDFSGDINGGIPVRAYNADSGFGVVKLIQPTRGAMQPYSHLAYTQVLQAGKRKEVSAFVQKLLPGAEDLQILTSANGLVPVLNVVYADRAIPVAASGEGAAALVQSAIELASASGGTVCIEEPEAFKHPRALELAADAIKFAVERGVQVILSTHSIQLLDYLVPAKPLIWALTMSGSELMAAKRDPTVREILVDDLR